MALQSSNTLWSYACNMLQNRVSLAVFAITRKIQSVQCLFCWNRNFLPISPLLCQASRGSPPAQARQGKATPRRHAVRNGQVRSARNQHLLPFLPAASPTPTRILFRILLLRPAASESSVRDAALLQPRGRAAPPHAGGCAGAFCGGSRRDMAGGYCWDVGDEEQEDRDRTGMDKTSTSEGKGRRIRSDTGSRTSITPSPTSSSSPKRPAFRTPLPPTATSKRPTTVQSPIPRNRDVRRGLCSGSTAAGL